MMDSLEEKFRKLRLNEEEDASIVVDVESLLDSIKKGERSLVGKLSIECVINKGVTRSIFSKCGE